MNAIKIMLLHIVSLTTLSISQNQYTYTTDSLAICALLGKCDSTCFLREECDYDGACPESTEYRCGPLVKLVSNARNGRITSLFLQSMLGGGDDELLTVRLKNLLYLTELETLVVEGGQIGFFPEEICSLTKLKALSLGGNSIDSIPPCIGNLKNLNVLLLLLNNLTSLPDEIAQLKSLKEISLRANSLAYVPMSLCSLMTLQHINLSFNQIESIPDEIGNLYECVEFDVGFNRLTSIPASIGNFRNCAILALDNNQLITLPAAIGNLRQIQRLYLFNNALTSLPENIVQLDSLFLNVSGNRLCNVSEPVTQWLDKYAGVDWQLSQQCTSSIIQNFVSQSIKLNTTYPTNGQIYDFMGRKMNPKLESHLSEMNINVPSIGLAINGRGIKAFVISACGGSKSIRQYGCRRK